ncbi:YwqG family protein [Oceanihabitans sp. 2_MG-2023]|uniref:YwqG family protein n=1 Tax=Oceanihabitans sp. 2_MG-2023 TaxID=3062661 RepID=UPI0026E13439|nr:YwqG family protein [Oceanihabitans sp. 2_MG-2023]MDO6598169.1 YwqG family protein [Oceanihabitans sp. 2_MG-2023]
MKKSLHLLLILISSTMFFGCFGNKKPSNYEKEKQKLITELKQYEWEEPEKVISLIEPNIYLSEGKSHKIGNSKFGGTPDLPVNTKWPNFKGEPMVFFAQINLEQTSHLDKENILPKDGILYFFTHFNKPESEYGSNYQFQMEKEKYQVLYYNGNLSSIKKTEFPKDLPTEFNFKEVPIDMDLEFRLPATTYTWKYQNLGLSEKDNELYEEILEQFEFCEGETTLGTPCPIQDAVEVDWAYSYLQSRDYKDENIKKQVQELRPDFINLLSFGMWGKFEAIGISGCYFGIRKIDLKTKDFSKVVFIIQDT